MTEKEILLQFIEGEFSEELEQELAEDGKGPDEEEKAEE